MNCELDPANPVNPVQNRLSSSFPSPDHSGFGFGYVSVIKEFEAHLAYPDLRVIGQGTELILGGERSLANFVSLFAYVKRNL